MRRFYGSCRNFKKSITGIHTVDKCLCLFMLVLLLQSAYCLFFPVNADPANIDVIVRTSAAAIFGYFLSGNFIRRAANTSSAASELTAAEEKVPDTKAASPDRYQENTMAQTIQIVIATSMGLFCLIILLIFKDSNILSASTPSALATITQFRDFVSGCIGFLIGCPTQNKR